MARRPADEAQGSGVSYAQVPIAELKHDPQNVRRHGQGNLDAVAASLRRFGQQKPIVATRDGTVIAGNATLSAARDLGWSAVAVRWTELAAEEARAYAIADNRTAELAEWDEDALTQALAALQEFDGDLAAATGFTGEEIGTGGEIPDEFKLVDDDGTLDCTCPRCGFKWRCDADGDAGEG